LRVVELKHRQNVRGNPDVPIISISASLPRFEVAVQQFPLDVLCAVGLQQFERSRREFSALSSPGIDHDLVPLPNVRCDLREPLPIIHAFG
jgi:hypothetical protein